MKNARTMETFPRHAIDSNPKNWTICVVLPTRDETHTLESVVQEIRAAFEENALKPPVILIADDSHDETRQIANQLGLKVVIGGGQGLGYAMLKGLKAALRFDPDVIVGMDADGQTDPREIMNVLNPIAQGGADMVVSSRFLKPGLIQYPYKRINRFGTIVLSWILRKVTGLPLTDSHGGLRAMRTEVVESLDIIGTHTYVQETIIDAYEKGYRIKEVPSIWRKRVHGQSKVVRSIVRYIMYTLPVLVIRSRNHIRWTYGAAFFLIVAGVLGFLIVMAQANFQVARIFVRLPALLAISMMVLAGIQLFTLGFLTEIGALIKLRVDQLHRQITSQHPTDE
jgi:glycosyltransferase involved in cell wall biosynthesis